VFHLKSPVKENVKNKRIQLVSMKHDETTGGKSIKDPPV
jgi:hypothetical protein